MAIGNIVQSNKEANFSDTSIKSGFKVTIKQASNQRPGNPAEAKSKDKFHKASRDYSRCTLESSGTGEKRYLANEQWKARSVYTDGANWENGNR